MAETRITPIETVGPYLAETAVPQLGTITSVPIDIVDGNVVTLATDILIVFTNTNVGAQTVTIESFPDTFGRVADITAFSIPASAVVARRFTRVGWGNGNGDLVIAGSSVDIDVEAFKV